MTTDAITSNSYEELNSSVKVTVTNGTLQEAFMFKMNKFCYLFLRVSKDSINQTYVGVKAPNLPSPRTDASAMILRATTNVSIEYGTINSIIGDGLSTSTTFNTGIFFFISLYRI